MMLQGELRSLFTVTVTRAGEEVRPAWCLELKSLTCIHSRNFDTTY